MSKSEALQILDFQGPNPTLDQINQRYKYMIGLSNNNNMKSEYL